MNHLASIDLDNIFGGQRLDRRTYGHTCIRYKMQFLISPPYRT
jgi:hypothetical protein